jgi:hypothetical protein
VLLLRLAIRLLQGGVGEGASHPLWPAALLLRLFLEGQQGRIV